MKDHSLYRYFDFDNQLLYVGRTTKPLNRLRVHQKASVWFKEVRTMTVQKFLSSDDLWIAEITAIRAENPKYNIHRYPIKDISNTDDIIDQIDNIYKNILENNDLIITGYLGISRVLGLGITVVKKLVDSGDLETFQIPHTRNRVGITIFQIIEYVESLRKKLE